MELTGPRVTLRPFSIEDAADVFAYASMPEVSRHLDWEPHRTLADTERFIDACLRRQPGVPLNFAVEHRQAQRVIGSFEIRLTDSIRRIGEIGYALAPGYWGQGYNLEAGRLLLDYGFADLHLLRIQALCDVDNRRSFRTMEKLGMVRERLLPRARFRKGIYVDRYVYGILWREWARVQRNLNVLQTEPRP